ncbi:uncharacterized protein VP01_1225g18 [Puccinia sorghi]|uniref:GAG-pre-integrase domain-containing protein n=1 Tax=Puccinia sorghi TaxID=27349 RepID=A0A0L6VQ56_9BASI|nr:uncharacterized protein VP01_1225g18 [Puccinia sorghi]
MQLFEVNNGHESEVSLLITEAARGHSNFLNATAVGVTTLSSSDSPNWHAHLGHPNSKYQSVMVPNSRSEDCGVCKQYKLKTLPFTGKLKPVKKTLEAVHVDLVGPFPVKSSAGFVYFLKLVDQFSGYRTVKFLKSKCCD